MRSDTRSVSSMSTTLCQRSAFYVARFVKNMFFRRTSSLAPAGGWGQGRRSRRSEPLSPTSGRGTMASDENTSNSSCVQLAVSCWRGTQSPRPPSIRAGRSRSPDAVFAFGESWKPEEAAHLALGFSRSPAIRRHAPPARNPTSNSRLRCAARLPPAADLVHTSATERSGACVPTPRYRSAAAVCLHLRSVADTTD